MYKDSTIAIIDHLLRMYGYYTILDMTGTYGLLSSCFTTEY